MTSKHLQPHPDGQTSMSLNHSSICFVWPPCPHTMQKLEHPVKNSLIVKDFQEMSIIIFSKYYLF